MARTPLCIYAAGVRHGAAVGQSACTLSTRHDNNIIHGARGGVALGPHPVYMCARATAETLALFPNTCACVLTAAARSGEERASSKTSSSVSPHRRPDTRGPAVSTPLLLLLLLYFFFFFFPLITVDRAGLLNRLWPGPCVVHGEMLLLRRRRRRIYVQPSVDGCVKRNNNVTHDQCRGSYF